MKEQIIKEMAQVLCDQCKSWNASAWCEKNMCGTVMEEAEALYNAGYRKPSKGEWIPVPSSDLSTGKAYKCSACKKMRYGTWLPPYCQVCGAKMAKPEEAAP